MTNIAGVNISEVCQKHLPSGCQRGSKKQFEHVYNANHGSNRLVLVDNGHTLQQANKTDAINKCVRQRADEETQAK